MSGWRAAYHSTGTAAPTHWVLLQVVPAQDTGLQPPEAVKPTSKFTAEAHVILETKCQLLNSPSDLESFVSPIWLSTYFQTEPCLQAPAFEWPSPFIYNENLNWIWQWQRCNACSNVLKYINSWTHTYCIFCYQYSNKLPIKPCYKKIEFSLKSTGPVYYCRNHIREDIIATLAQNKPDST